MKTKEAIYFPMVLLASNIVITFMSYFIINYFEFLPNEESPRYARNQVILQMIITSVLMFIVCYELSSTFFSEEFSFFVDESKDTTSFKTLKNLEKKKAKPELITICVILGYFAEKIFIFSFEFFSSSNGAPSKALIRSCETGPCFNLITANVINSIVYPIIIIIVAGLFFAGYGILGYFGISLMALGALSNIVMIYSINMIGDLGNNSYRLTALTKFNENSKEKLFNMSWYPHNYKAFLRGVEFLVLILAGFAIAGNFICFLNDFNLIILKSLQSFGLILGFVVPYLLNGIVICEVQYVTNHIVRLLVFYKNINN